MPTDIDQKDVSVKNTDHVLPDMWIVSDRKKRTGGIALAIVVVFVIIMFWITHQDTVVAENTDKAYLDISSRVIVPELKPLPEDAIGILSNKRHENWQRDEAEVSEEDKVLRDARIKSAIVALDLSTDESSHHSEQVTETSTDKGPQDANSQFIQSVSGHGVQISAAQTIHAMEYKILQGKMIEAVLESRATSDLPGMVCATVQRDIYGARDRIKLIPWGARICGQYSAEVRTGQDRLFVVWNTLRRPDGVEVSLDSVGADQLGTAGMGGLVDTHFAKIFGVSSLLSIIGAGSGNMKANAYESGHAGAYYRDSVQMAASQTAQQILQPYINMQPTIIVPAGARIRIYVNRDLDFSAVYRSDNMLTVQHDVMIYE